MVKIESNYLELTHLFNVDRMEDGVDVSDDVVGVDEVWSVTLVICCCWREFSLFFLDIFVATL